VLKKRHPHSFKNLSLYSDIVYLVSVHQAKKEREKKNGEKSFRKRQNPDVKGAVDSFFFRLNGFPSITFLHDCKRLILLFPYKITHVFVSKKLEGFY
jgi:hypothetical protein